MTMAPATITTLGLLPVRSGQAARQHLAAAERGIEPAAVGSQPVLHMQRHFSCIVPRNKAAGFKLLQPARQHPRGNGAGKCAAQRAKAYRLVLTQRPDNMAHPLARKKLQEVIDAAARHVEHIPVGAASLVGAASHRVGQHISHSRYPDGNYCPKRPAGLTE